MKNHRYNVTLGSNLDEGLSAVAKTMGITRSEVMRRALLLFKHAVKAEAVKLTIKNEDGQSIDQLVLVK